jgi:hypothetical protein
MDRLDIDLKCCCCGRVLDTLETQWSSEVVSPLQAWTREPCAPCELDLATEAILRRTEMLLGRFHVVTYDPRD